jgi:probable phosphoglycerate mutase
MLILIRHGLAARGVADLDPGLADVGHEQARLTADALRGANAGRLAVSPLRRTQETATPIASVLGLEPELREEVAEVFDPSMPVEERQNMIGPFMQGFWSKQPEHLRAWRQRAVDTLLEMGLAAEAAGQDLIVVSHYIAISVAVGEASGDDRVIPAPIANCSLTRIEVGDDGLSLVEAGSSAHLTPELATGTGQALAGR